ncbi:Flp family type IVb pilin [Streptomyces sp. NPDC006711]|uniref:Flp family type IVb pilin n=1 Tax=unclassified Streptomyces TaxID=2593676 RepID=UPI0033EBBF54
MTYDVTPQPEESRDMPQDTLLKTAVAAQLRVRDWRDTAVARVQRRYVSSAGRDRGQTSFEYLGIILVVVAIIGGIMATGIGTSITNKIKEQIDKIKAGG